MMKYYIGFGVLSVIVLGLVIYGFTVVGSPSLRQAINYDQTRMGHFSSMSYSIQTYYYSHQKLPTSSSDIISFSSYKDPQTNTPYLYQTITPTTYKLCATFSEDSSKEKESDSSLLYYNSDSSKTHSKGYDCIEYIVTASSSYDTGGFMIPDSVSSNSSSYNNADASAKARDARRMADVRQIQTALELYYNDCGHYPAALTISSNSGCPAGTTMGTYLGTIPANPDPGGAPYVYSSSSPYTTYTLSFVFEAGVSPYGIGAHVASPYGIDQAF